MTDKVNKKKIKEVKVIVGKTPCNKYCSYFSGTDMPHDCGKPIYETMFKCLICKEVFISKPAIKTHFTIKHKNDTL